MQPSATPFDIQPIPYFSYSPGIITWSYLIALLVLSGLYFRFAPKIRARRYRIKAFEFARKELLLIAHSSSGRPSKVQASLLSTMLKRVLDLSCNLSLSQMTPSDLEKFSTSTSDLNLKALVNTILSLDAVKYVRNEDSKDFSKQAIESVIKELDDLEKKLQGAR